jgi:polysaccharide deacetylase 2 family uncharacterized protein YibQ
MARKRKRARRVNPAPILIIAVLLAAVVWAILPRPQRHVTHRAHRVHPVSVAQATASPSPVEAATPQASPAVSPEATLAPSPAATPAASPTVAPTQNPNGVQVALIIDDCGQWLTTERGLIALPIPITLSVLPHVHYTTEIAQEASDAGKGVMMHLPMEPLSHANPGPGEIKTAMADDAVTKQTEDDVAQVPLAKGVNNHEGSEASADGRVMKDVIAVVKEHNLFFIDSRTNAKSVGAAQAQEAGVPTASRNVFLDNQADVAYTESMLEHAVAVAKRDGSAIAIGHPRPTTLEAIRDMYPKMQAEGVRFVLAQDLVH